MAPQLNEKGWITPSQVDPVTAWNTQARYAAVRCVQAAGRGSMKGTTNVGSVCSGQSVQPDVMTDVYTPFCLRLTGPTDVYADAVMTQ